MKICRYQETADGPVKVGVVIGDTVRDVTRATEELPDVRWPYPPGDLFIANLDRLRPVMEEMAEGALPIPVVRRQNIWRNSRRRLAECRPRLGIDVRRRACGVASADVRWSVA